MSATELIEAEPIVQESDQVQLEVPIEVKWMRSDDRPFEERTVTLSVHPRTALIALTSCPDSPQEVTITNLFTNASCPFRVVGPTGQPHFDGSAYVVECLEPEQNFWGIFAEPKVMKPAREKLVETALECSQCELSEVAQLTARQSRTLEKKQSMRRHCPLCRKMTDWKAVAAVAPREEYAPQAKPIAPPVVRDQGDERRRVERIEFKLPVRVRLADGREEVTRSYNVSKTGICLSCQMDIKDGAYVMLTFNRSEATNRTETLGKIRWRRPIEGGQILYGIEFRNDS